MGHACHDAKLALLLLCLSTSRELAAQGFPAAAEEIFAAKSLSSATVGALFVSVADGVTHYSRSPDLPLLPASTAKLASSAAALDFLKPEFSFATSFLIDKKDQGQKKLSVLVWRGTGDPSISGRGRASREEVFEVWASSLAALGVSQVKRLVLDTRYFEGPATVPAWPEDELAYWYEAETSPISFNDNCVDLEFRPAAKPGRRPQILLAPDYGYVKVKNKAKTGPADGPYTMGTSYHRKPDSNQVEFTGLIPADGQVRRDYASVHDPARFAAETLKRVWRRKGIEVSKIVLWEKAGLQEDELAPLLVWRSEPLAELVKIINKNSQNFYAEQLLKTLGKEASGHGSFAAGLEAVRAFLLRAGLTDAQFHLVDGSGLSEQDRFTASGLVRVLIHMRSTPLFPVYFESLAVPGVDRAAKDRMKGDPLASGMRLKRGTVGHARNLAGYLRSASGKLYAFAVLVNGADLDRRGVDEALDRLCLAAAHKLP
ncbi:MAG: D-alanyl-D-alanine carboxypeptidase/D-alanyl-D-alanine-endopeptidase [Elusimicrobia bacterium]|nr:D-alanyl-D-alanine carboxypeptidase/D-alanyl-D-alanine-endopeptidase [Elusimicrobiota bacterium]